MRSGEAGRAAPSLPGRARPASSADSPEEAATAQTRPRGLLRPTDA